MYNHPSSSRIPRESVYPPTDHLNSLEDCVTATEGCCSELDAAVAKLQPGIRDLPRLTRILSNRHRYLLLPQPTLAAHKESLATSLAPQIDALIARAEKAIEQGDGRKLRLDERLEILQSAPKPQVDPTGFTITQRRKLAMMKGRRERLEKERESLQ